MFSCQFNTSWQPLFEGKITKQSELIIVNNKNKNRCTEKNLSVDVSEKKKKARKTQVASASVLFPHA